MADVVTIETLARDIKIIRNLLSKQEKKTWVGASVITELTGWQGSNKFRWARDNNLVEYDAKKGYLLESLNEHFIKPKNTN